MAQLIFIKGTTFFLTPSYSLSIQQTNLLDSTVFSDRGVYFEIEKISFDIISKCLKVRVVNYNLSNKLSFATQTLKDDVLRLEFTELERNHVEKSLISFRTTLWQKADVFKIEPEQQNDSARSPFATSKKMDELFNFNHHLESITFEEPLEFQVKFKKTCFKRGYVSFNYTPDFFGESIEFRIENSFIIPEFDNIKTYFPKAFNGQKYFNVKATLKLGDAIGSFVKATSVEIAEINESLIERITQDRVYQLKSKIVNSDSNKMLFTENDMFDDGNVLNQSGQALIESLYNHPKTRNRKQLEYLSGHKHSPSQKIRFTLGSNFGFLFYIEGKYKYHYCWELLNSHATYLWSSNKGEVEGGYSIIETEIRKIYNIGREQYLNDYKDQITFLNFSFNRIGHIDINSTVIDGFIIWKQNLEKHLL